MIELGKIFFIPTLLINKVFMHFFVLNISKNGPHKGFNVHGSIMSEVQNAILVSDIPKFLYMIALAVDKATKGNPIANQVLGIQNNGDFGVVG